MPYMSVGQHFQAKPILCSFWPPLSLTMDHSHQSAPLPSDSPSSESSCTCAGCRPLSLHRLCRRQNGLTWNVAEAGLCRLPAQCKQQGEVTELLWNTPPVKLPLKGKHLLPRESLYFTSPLGSTLDLTANCSGVKLEKSTSSPHVTIK